VFDKPVYLWVGGGGFLFKQTKNVRTKYFMVSQIKQRFFRRELNFLGVPAAITFPF